MAHSFQCTSNKACVLCVCPQGWGLGLQDTPLSAAASVLLSTCTLPLCVCVCACAILSHSYHSQLHMLVWRSALPASMGSQKDETCRQVVIQLPIAGKNSLSSLFLFLVHPLPIFFPLLSFLPLSLSTLSYFPTLFIFFSFSPPFYFVIFALLDYSLSFFLRFPLSPLHPHPVLHHTWRRWEGIQNIVLPFSFIFFTRSLLHFTLPLARLIRSLSTRCTRHAASTKCKSGSIPASLKP